MRRVLVIAGIATLLAIAAWWRFPENAARALARHEERLVRVERVPAPEHGARVERWRMLTARGDSASALWRSAASGGDSTWTIVLLGGLVSGERALLLLPADARANVLAVDWPWREPRDLRWWEVALRAGRARRAALRSPAMLALGVEAAAREPEVDARRIALVGVSLGVPPAVAAIRHTRRPAALVMLHGAADLRLLMRRGLEREGLPRVAATALAALGARLLHALEPAAHAETWHSRPVLVVQARTDPFLPTEAVRQLHALFPQADVRWRPGIHGVPDRRAAIQELSSEVVDWLEGG
jgi:hypothetical protein